MKRNRKAKESQTTKYTKIKRISKNKNYQKGRQFEYRVKKHFEKLGYYVVRKYASKGAEDLIAIKSLPIKTIDFNKKAEFVESHASEVFFVQCKNLKVERPLAKEDADRLKKLAKQGGGTPLLASNRDHKLVIEEVW